MLYKTLENSMQFGSQSKFGIGRSQTIAITNK